MTCTKEEVSALFKAIKEDIPRMFEEGLKALHKREIEERELLERDPGPWKVQVKGERCSSSWEISVVRENNKLGQRSWGWFNEHKLLVSHNGGPCMWPIVPFVWDQQIAIANELCRQLNAGETYEN